MVGLISRAALDGADEWDGGCNPTREEYIREHMARVPAVNAVPVVNGHWAHIHIKGKEYGKVYYQHENCVPLLFESPYHYCPHCGAKMNGERRDSE